MSYPRAVFLDTCIFDQNQYNFGSAAITSFVEAARKRKLQLLLPDPTSKEIQRHIRERAAEALEALDKARRKAPFLAKWKVFSQLKNQALADWEVHTMAQAEWRSFLKQFDTVPLGYEGVKTETVMAWYDGGRAPFGKGRKEKEFPDAFAVAILAAFAAEKSATIAVVSMDEDMKAACESFGRLLYFPSLQQFTESLLADEHAVENLRAVIEADKPLLVARMTKRLTGARVYHTRDRYKIQDTNLGAVKLLEFHIVAVGHEECTITFEAEVEVEADLSWVSRDGPDDEYYEETDRVSDRVEVSGTAKLKLKPNAGGIAEIPFIELNDAELPIASTPDPHE